MKVIIGVDPGTSFTGLALATQIEGFIVLQTGVLLSRGTIYYPVNIIEEMLGDHETTVIVEDYSVRPQGHQKWSRALVPRMLGALEFVTKEIGDPFHNVPPGRHQEDLKSLGFHKWLKKWKRRWPHSSNVNWDHALSAWRVLGLGLTSFQRHRPVLDALRSPFKPLKRFPTVPTWEKGAADLKSDPIALRINDET